MGWEAAATGLVVIGVLALLITNAVGPDLAFAAAAVVLTALGVFTARLPVGRDIAQAFGNEAVLTIAAFYVVATGLNDTGAIRLLTDRILKKPRSDAEAQLRLALPVVGLSAFVFNTPVVAMFLPIVSDWCRRHGLSRSKLFIPLSYLTILGGCCTLVGTSSTLIVAGLLGEARRADPSMPSLSFVTIGAVGIPLAIAGIVYIAVAAPRLLPDRQPPSAALEDRRQYTVEMEVDGRGGLPGRTVEQAGLRHLSGVFLSAIEREGERLVAVGPEQRLRAGDRLIFVGVVESIADLQRVRGLTPAADQIYKVSTARHERQLIEAVVSASCPLVGQTIRDGRFRTRYDAVVLAVYREGERIARKVGDITLRAGDTLLLESHPRFLDLYRGSRDFLLTSAVSDSVPPRSDRAWMALAILAGLIVTAVLGGVAGVPFVETAVLAAGLMLLTNCCSPERARASINLPVLVAVGSALVISRATQTSGLALALAHAAASVVGSSSPTLMLASVYLMTLVCTELTTHAAAPVFTFPIAHAWAASAGLNVLPFAVAIAIAASAGFALPLGYQTHLMVYGLGSYRLSDFIRIGLPLDAIAMAVTVLLTPLVFPFQ